MILIFPLVILKVEQCNRERNIRVGTYRISDVFELFSLFTRIRIHCSAFDKNFLVELAQNRMLALTSFRKIT